MCPTVESETNESTSRSPVSMGNAKPCARSEREPWSDLVASTKAVSTVLSDAGHGLRIKRVQGFEWGSAEVPSVHTQRVVTGCLERHRIED
jgi:hypothetical protein